MRAANRFVFTPKSIEKLPIPSTQSNTKACYYDSKIRGLALYITATGIKTFFVYRRVHGRPERIIIGRINEVTLEQARAKAGLINAQIADGKNPQAARRAIWQDTQEDLEKVPSDAYNCMFVNLPCGRLASHFV